MSEYKENLSGDEVLGIFDELGLGLLLNKDELFRAYAGRKWTLMRHDDFPVILNVLPGTEAAGEPFWEEWYIQKGTVHHHILTRDEPEEHDEIFICPESDDIHPPEVWGKTWYVQNRTGMVPLLIPADPG